MALTNDFLIMHAHRINDILERAWVMGDGAAVMGTIILLSLSDEQWDEFMNSGGDVDRIQELLDPIEAKLNAAGINTR